MTVEQHPADGLGGLAPELRFIIDRCRPAPAAVPPGGLDWTKLAYGLDRHGLTRLIPALIATPGLIPEPAVAPLRALHVERAAAALSQLRETMKLCGLLEGAGIRFLLVKGVTLSIQLFGQPGIRSSKDIDLLVEPGSLARVDTILASIGYERPAEDRAKDRLQNDIVKEIGYLNHAAGMMVEIHTRLTDNEHLFAPDFESLWESRELLSIGGRTLPALSRDLLPIYLSIHGAKHNWARLMWLLDLVPLINTRDAADAALAQAREHGVEGVMLHSLWLLHHWFGHEVDPGILALADARLSVRILNRLAVLYHRDPRWFEQAPRHSWRRFYLNSVLGRATSYSIKRSGAYWRSQLAFDLISPADRTLIAVPKRFDWAYALLRPFGWLVRRLRR